MQAFAKNWLSILALATALVWPITTFPNSAELDQLFEQLQTSNELETRRLEQEIIAHWSDSGSRTINRFLQQGRIATIQRRFGLALRLLDRVVELAPEFAEGWNARATAHYLNGDYLSSVSDIAVTLELNPRHFGAINGLAMILEAIGDDAGALAAYREVEKLTPNRNGVEDAILRLENAIVEKAI